MQSANVFKPKFKQLVKYLTPTSKLFLFLAIVTGPLALANDEPPATQKQEQPDQIEQPLEQVSSEPSLVLSSEPSSEPSSEQLQEQPPGKLVLVAGATGGTGREVVRELLANGYRVRAFVRDEAEARASLGDEVEYAVGDVRERATIDAALNGIDALISAIGAGRGDSGNGPEFVDYGGVRNMAEAAAGLRQFVLVSSMGVTHEDHALNKMFNNVLQWKFKGDEALRASGVPYTIIRPGELDDGPGGQKTIAFFQGDDQSGMISRVDLARVCVASLGSEAAVNKTFEVNNGKPLTDDPKVQDLDLAFAALAADPEAMPIASDESTSEQLQ